MPDSSYQVSFKSIAHAVRETKFKIDFQDGYCGGHLGCPIGTILAIYLKLTPILPTNFLPRFELVGILVLQNKFKIDFQDGDNL